MTNLGEPRDGTGTGRRPPANPRRARLLLLTALALVTADLVAKILVVAFLTDRSVKVLGGLVYLTQARNSGAAWSFAEGMTIVFTAVAVAVVVVIVRTAPRLRSAPWAVSLGLILGGASGNLIDRLFRAPAPLRGAVVDWISVFAPYGERFPIFNLADSGITIGGILAVALATFGYELDGSRPRDEPRPAAPSRPAPAGGTPRIGQAEPAHPRPTPPAAEEPDDGAEGDPGERPVAPWQYARRETPRKPPAPPAPQQASGVDEASGAGGVGEVSGVGEANGADRLSGASGVGEASGAGGANGPDKHSGAGGAVSGGE